MPRGTARVMVVSVVAAVLLTGAGGFFLWNHRSPPAPSVLWGPKDGHVRDPSATVYNAPTGVLFDTGSASLNQEAVPALHAIASDIKKLHPSGTIWVEGYTDDVGSDQFNHTLSGERAMTVKVWLEQEAGIAGSRMRVTAYGERNPTQPNDSEEHRQANRRVVITVERPPGPTPSAS